MDDHQQTPPLADDAKFLDSLLELDRGLRKPDVVEDRPPQLSVTAPAGGAEPADTPLSADFVIGAMAPRRRPWRATVAATPPEPSPPPLGRRARGPSIGTALPPTLPSGRLKRSLAAVPLDAPGPSTASQTYEMFYGFDEKPFSLSSDLKFVYHSASFDRAMQDLIDAIDRRDAMMLLTGENGTGKTTLCRSLLSQLGDPTRTTFLSDPPATADALDVLQQPGVVIVDDAQRWSVEALEQIRRLAEGARAEGPQIVLVGGPELLTRLGGRALRRLDQRIRTRCRLDPLTADEVVGYVTHRLAVAGTRVRIGFDEGAMMRLHAVSRGIPRVINLVCDRALAEGHRLSASRIDATLIDTVSAELHLPAPRSGVRLMVQGAAILVAFVICLLIGAGMAAWVFRADIERAIGGPDTAPALPAAPEYDPPTLTTPLPPDQGSLPRAP